MSNNKIHRHRNRSGQEELAMGRASLEIALWPIESKIALRGSKGREEDS